MKNFKRNQEFEKEFKKLEKKYSSLSDDLEAIEKILIDSPTGVGKNFKIIHFGKEIKIVKVRLLCDSLRNRNIRVIYAVHDEGIEFVYIEIYFKGDKENHDYERVEEYIKNHK